MENGEQWPIQSILLGVERRWVAGITIKPTSSPDYDQALRIIHTLEIAPRCQADPELALLGPQAELRGALETIVARELEVRQTENWPAFQLLAHSETDPQWLEQQHHLLGPDLKSIDLTRIERSGEWALAAAIETHITDDSPPSQFYTTRTFRQAAKTGCWELTSPNSDAWIERGDGYGRGQWALDFGSVNILYLPFDEPYVRAAGPRLALVLPEMTADFGITLAKNNKYIVRVHPFPDMKEPPMSGNAWWPVTASPLWPGFPIGSVQSPEEYLLGSLTDVLGHELLEDEFGERAQEPARLALAHTAVQWDVEQAVGRDRSAQLRAQVAEARTPLAVLLDPTLDPAAVDAVSRAAEQDLFLRFALAEYGKEILPPFLRAVFTADSADELIRRTFGQEPEIIERQWRAWRE